MTSAFPSNGPKHRFQASFPPTDIDVDKRSAIAQTERGFDYVDHLKYQFGCSAGQNEERQGSGPAASQVIVLEIGVQNGPAAAPKLDPPWV